MRWLRNIRLVLALVIGIPLAIFAGIMAIMEYVSGSGTLHVTAPYASAVTVRVDGVEMANITAGGHRALELEQGDHQLEIARADAQVEARDLDVGSGFYEQLAPSPGQCFVELDGTEAYYGSASAPEVEGRYFGHEPFDVGSSHYFDEAALPSTIQDGNHVYLVFEVPCELQGASDAQLLTAAGYNG